MPPNISEEYRILHEILANTKEAMVATRTSIETVRASLLEISRVQAEHYKLAQEINTKQDSFYKYSVVSLVFFILFLIGVIAALLSAMNIHGAKVISDAAVSAGTTLISR